MQSPLENSRKHIVLMGIIAARWATLDNALVLLLSNIVGHSVAHAIFFSTASQRMRLEQLRAVIAVSKWSNEDKQRIADLILRLGELWKTRNDLIHNPVVASDAHKNSPETKFWARVTKPLTKTGGKEIALTLEHLKGHASDLSKIGEELFEFTFAPVRAAFLDAREQGKKERRRASRKKRAAQARHK